MAAVKIASILLGLLLLAGCGRKAEPGHLAELAAIEARAAAVDPEDRGAGRRIWALATAWCETWAGRGVDDEELRTHLAERAPRTLALGLREWEDFERGIDETAAMCRWLEALREDERRANQRRRADREDDQRE